MKSFEKTLRILITAGPTREYIDPVRYLSNDSSGQMGFSLAAAARRLGCDVTLVAGPVALPTPAGVKRIDVISARDMQCAVTKVSAKTDVIIMAAAVADWRPSRTSRAKIKKTTASSKPHSIALIENPDILAELGKKKKPHQILVGFALETEKLERNARAKLAHKRCDWIVANLSTSIGARQSSAILISADGRRTPLPRLLKEDLAVVILSHVLG
jgi:phosphopantothenoylcysteine decarboxylase / phosphopantothenate---cysteine ligase